MVTWIAAGVPPLVPAIHVPKPLKFRHQQPGTICRLPVRVNNNLKVELVANGSACRLKQRLCKPPVMKYQQGKIVYLFGGKDKSEKNKESFPWSFEKVMENFKGQSVEDLLRQQIEKQEFYDGGSGKNPPRGGGGGGGSDRDGFGGSEDEGIPGIMEETLQVFLATVGFILLYIYIISGEEWIRLGKDYIKFLLRGSKSVRLKRAMYKWKKFYDKLTEVEVADKFWLEKEIVNTTTVYDNPSKYRRVFKSILESQSDE